MAAHRFTLSLEGQTEEFTVGLFRGRERLNALPHFDVTFVASSPLSAEAVLGHRVRLLIHAGHTRLVTGIVDRFWRGKVLAHGRASHRVRIVPAATRLTRRKTSRVFQELTTLEIARKLFDEHGVELRIECLGTLPVREVCIQYDSTDWDFLTGLFAEEGLVFRVDHPLDSDAATVHEVVTVFDHSARYRPLDGGERLVYRPIDEAGGAMLREEHHVSELVAGSREGSKSVLCDEYDFKFPSRFATSAAPVPAAAQAFPRKKPVVGLDTVVEPAGPYGEMQAVSRDAEVVRQQLTRKSQLFRGRSECARLAPGRAFTLEEHEDSELSGKYAVTEVRHQGKAQGSESSYANELSCVKQDFLFRPPRPERRVRQSMEGATVVGPSGEEIYTDELGRIKVEFHWDMLGSSDERSSCWLRVAQGWAGSGWGHQFIPRIGMEVIVAYLGGDPDRPIVVGCLPNATHAPPFALPHERTRSGIKTKSTPDSAGFNEISFQDAAGGEELRMIAQRDHNTKVGRNQHTAVGGDRSVDVAGSHSETVAGAKTLLVVGPAVTSLSAGGQLEVSGLYRERIDGDLAVTISEDRVVAIEGSDRREVNGPSDERVVGPLTLRANSSYTLVVGSPEAPGHADLQIQGSYGLTVDDVARIDAHGGLVLRCGESSIELTHDAITLRAPTIKLKGEAVTVEGDGPALKLTDKAELAADTIKIYAKESSLELDQDASLKGKMLYLNCKKTTPASSSDESEQQTKKLSVRLSDENFEPYASKHYELRVDAEKWSGETSSDGTVEHDVPEAAKTATLTLWIEKYPTGKQREYTLVLIETPAIDTTAGVKVRLRNLGYYTGPADDDLDEAARAALLDFQGDHELEPSGVIDEATKQALEKRHGH